MPPATRTNSARTRPASLAARAAKPVRVVVAFQPHRYSRLNSLFEEFCTCFNDADVVVVADVYSAGESPLPGIDREALVDGLLMHGHRAALPLPGADALPRLIAELARPGDFVVCLGAGNISAWANALPGDLERLATGGGRREGGGCAHGVFSPWVIFREDVYRYND